MTRSVAAVRSKTITGIPEGHSPDSRIALALIIFLLPGANLGIKSLGFLSLQLIHKLTNNLHKISKAQTALRCTILHLNFKFYFTSHRWHPGLPTFYNAFHLKELDPPLCKVLIYM